MLKINLVGFSEACNNLNFNYFNYYTLKGSLCKIWVVGQFELEGFKNFSSETISSIAHAWSLIPAAIAGVTPNVL